MLQKKISEAKDIMPDEVTEIEYQSLQETIIKMEKQVSELPNFPTLEIPEEQKLGPKPMRELKDIKAIDFDSLPILEVMPTIDNLFTQANPNYRWENFFSDNHIDQISRCYFLMNWVGYFADDFDKVKKRKDRFRASHNDTMHVINASPADYLISNDKLFLQKAKACYAYLNLGVTVCDPHNFIRQHSKLLK